MPSALKCIIESLFWGVMTMLSRGGELLMRCVRFVGLVALSTQCALGQGNAPVPQSQGINAHLPSYDVASVKPTEFGDGGMRIMFTPDGVLYTNVALQIVLQETFGMDDSRILGAPSWVKTGHFDIEAKVEATDAPKLKMLSSDQKRMMLMPVLVDRFNLKFHHDTRQLPIYALVIAKSGQKLKEATPGDTYPNGMKIPDGHSGAGMMAWGSGKITGQGVAIASLVKMLSDQGLGRTIVDKTGLTGKYDLDLQWSPDDSPPPVARGTQTSPSVNDDSTDSGASLFTALQEQLGLKLESQKGPVDVIVIDHIERPSEN